MLEIPVSSEMAEFLPVDDSRKGTMARHKKPARFELTVKSTFNKSSGNTADIRAKTTNKAPSGGDAPFSAVYENLLIILFSNFEYMVVLLEM
ncbi:hypothetical protein G6F42_017217 [Rhizopus arrhizus]|nr:hypothetical protein G6F42_017217 [Rhizopus arrhizus]